MSTLAPARRQRALEAMGLGPAWVLRTRPADGGGPAPTTADRATTMPPAERASCIATLAWDSMRDEVSGCVACPLSRSRTQTVFGAGAMRPEWLVIGEAPGADEDLQGEPFVEQAGKLLDAMLASVGLSRERDVFVTNVVKCMPPAAREPASEEVDRCRPFLERQIALLQPKLILVVGEVASASVLSAGATLTRLQGRPHRLSIGGREIPVVVTFGPAHLLRHPEEKAGAWRDLCLARDTYRRSLGDA